MLQATPAPNAAPSPRLAPPLRRLSPANVAQTAKVTVPPLLSTLARKLAALLATHRNALHSTAGEGAAMSGSLSEVGLCGAPSLPPFLPASLPARAMPRAGADARRSVTDASFAPPFRIRIGAGAPRRTAVAAAECKQPPPKALSACPLRAVSRRPQPMPWLSMLMGRSFLFESSMTTTPGLADAADWIEPKPFKCSVRAGGHVDGWRAASLLGLSGA